MAPIIFLIFLSVIYDRLAKNYDKPRITTILRGIGAFMVIPLLSGVIAYLLSDILGVTEKVETSKYAGPLAIIALIYVYLHYQKLKSRWS